MNLSCSIDAGSGDPEADARLRENQTARIVVAGNLDARELVPVDNWNAQAPSDTSTLSTALDVIDPFGRSHLVEIYFRKEKVSTFSFHVLVPGDDWEPRSENAFVEAGSGELTFDTDGALLSTSGTGELKLRFLESEKSQDVGIDFGNAKSDGGDGLGGISQYALDSYISYQSQKAAENE